MAAFATAGEVLDVGRARRSCAAVSATTGEVLDVGAAGMVDGDGLALVLTVVVGAATTPAPCASCAWPRRRCGGRVAVNAMAGKVLDVAGSRLENGDGVGHVEPVGALLAR